MLGFFFFFLEEKEKGRRKSYVSASSALLRGLLIFLKYQTERRAYYCNPPSSQFRQDSGESNDNHWRSLPGLADEEAVPQGPLNSS